MKSQRVNVVRGCKLLAASLLLQTLPAAALQQSESFTVGTKTPVRLALDPVTDRVFIADSVPSYSSAGALSVLESTGQVTNVALSGPPDNVAVSALFRTALVPIGGCTCTALVNTDTLAVTMTGGGENSKRVVITEITGHAYVLASGMMNGFSGTSSITDIDLRSGASMTYPVPTMGVVDMAADASGTKLYVIGSELGGFAQWNQGFVQIFDIPTKAMAGSRMPVGRQPIQVMAPAGSGEVYVLGHSDYLDTSIPSGDPRRNSIQPTVFALNAASLAPQRSILLPYTSDMDLFGPELQGKASVDATTGVLYVTDSNNNRFMVVDPSSGTVSSVDLESGPLGIAANPAAGNVIVTLNRLGLAAIFSMSGERLDTVPIGTALSDPRYFTGYDVAVDAAGNAYATSGHDHSVALLKRDASAPAVVNLTDVWSDPGDPGWGVFVQQQGAIAFAALFIHDAAGAPRWAVMPQGMRQGDGSFAGNLYRTTGPATTAGATSTSLVGTMRFAASSLQAATLTYTLDGLTFTRSLSRLPISVAQRTCAWTANTLKSSAATATNFTSLWWNPAQSGWGLALSQQGSTAFAVLFGYDAANQPTWNVMANGAQSAAQAFGGTLYRANSGGVSTVGDMSLSFTATDAGTLSYRLDGALVATPIVREEFSTPSSRCSS